MANKTTGRKNNLLNPKQRRFAEEYVIDLNGTQAAIRAGYSEKTAGVIADENLKKPYIKRFINKLQKQLRKQTNISAVAVVEELAKVGFSNVQDFIEASNSIADISKVDKKKAAAVSGIETSESTSKDGTVTVNTKFKLYNKVDALEKLGRHLGIFEKDNQQSKPDTTITFTETIISKQV